MVGQHARKRQRMIANGITLPPRAARPSSKQRRRIKAAAAAAATATADLTATLNLEDGREAEIEEWSDDYIYGCELCYHKAFMLFEMLTGYADSADLGSSMSPRDDSEATQVTDASLQERSGTGGGKHADVHVSEKVQGQHAPHRISSL